MKNETVKLGFPQIRDYNAKPFGHESELASLKHIFIGLGVIGIDRLKNLRDTLSICFNDTNFKPDELESYPQIVLIDPKILEIVKNQEVAGIIDEFRRNGITIAIFDSLEAYLSTQYQNKIDSSDFVAKKNWFWIQVPTSVTVSSTVYVPQTETLVKVIDEIERDEIFQDSIKVISSTVPLNLVPYLNKKNYFVCPERYNEGENVYDQYQNIGVALSTEEELQKVVEFLGIRYCVSVDSIVNVVAAKIYENTQRAFLLGLSNEVKLMVDTMAQDSSFNIENAGCSYETINELAGNKPNFQKVKPGLIGGDCIPNNIFFWGNTINDDLNGVYYGSQIYRYGHLIKNDVQILLSGLLSSLGVSKVTTMNVLKICQVVKTPLLKEWDLLKYQAQLGKVPLTEDLTKAITNGISEIDGYRFTITNLSYKPGTDSVAHSKALELATKLLYIISLFKVKATLTVVNGDMVNGEKTELINHSDIKVDEDDFEVDVFIDGHSGEVKVYEIEVKMDSTEIDEDEDDIVEIDDGYRGTDENGEAIMAGDPDSISDENDQILDSASENNGLDTEDVTIHDEPNQED